MTRKAKQGSEEDYSKIKFTGPDVISGRKRLQYLAQVFGQLTPLRCLDRPSHSGKMGITGGKLHKNGKILNCSDLKGFVRHLGWN